MHDVYISQLASLRVVIACKLYVDLLSIVEMNEYNMNFFILIFMLITACVCETRLHFSGYHRKPSWWCQWLLLGARYIRICCGCCFWHDDFHQGACDGAQLCAGSQLLEHREEALGMLLLPLIEQPRLVRSVRILLHVCQS